MTWRMVLERMSGQMGLFTREDISGATSMVKESSHMPVGQNMKETSSITRSKATAPTPR